MLKIFTLNKTIYLIDNQASLRKGITCTEIGSVDEMDKKYNELVTDLNTSTEVYFYNTNLSLLFNYFKSLFKIIEAAGGLVRNKKGEWLFIFRNGKWDLPKGKIEKGESIKKAAIREVEEECGVKNLKIIKELNPTYHIYSHHQKNILKPTYWFKMECGDTSKLIPQTEEGITEVKWMAADKLQPVFDNTYESIKEVLKEIKDY
jgi:8-oxo-dGTP pyrophosphatase MutT (NUDIX family)